MTRVQFLHAGNCLLRMRMQHKWTDHATIIPDLTSIIFLDRWASIAEETVDKAGRTDPNYRASMAGGRTGQTDRGTNGCPNRAHKSPSPRRRQFAVDRNGQKSQRPSVAVVVVFGPSPLQLAQVVNLKSAWIAADDDAEETEKKARAFCITCISSSMSPPTHRNESLSTLSYVISLPQCRPLVYLFTTTCQEVREKDLKLSCLSIPLCDSFFLLLHFCARSTA